MKRRWTTTRKWEASKTEAYFEERLKEEGFMVKGIREYLSKTDFLLEKDGMEFEWSYHEPQSKTPPKKAATKYAEFLIRRLNLDFGVMSEIRRLQNELKGERA